MRTEARVLGKWAEPAYSSIHRAFCDRKTDLVTVEFEDGTSVTFDVMPLLPEGLDDLDLWRIAANEMEIIVPYGEKWFEIPWDVIRRYTDPEYAGYWEDLSIAYRANVESEANAGRELPPVFE